MFNISLKKKGSALILVMFIMAGMLVVALGGSYITLLSIKAGGIQSQSIKAYYAAEAGTEKFLYELRRKGLTYPDIGVFPVIIPLPSPVTLINGGTYQVNFVSGYNPPVFNIVGQFQNTKRSIEIRL